ncbi:MAG: flavodoxin family protein [Clostridia bacterium]
MNVKVMYHSKTGNTRKLAEAMAEALGIAAEPINEKSIVEPVDEPIDMLFIGDGVYAGGSDRITTSFIKTLNGSLVKNAAVFGTYGGQKKAVTKMKELLKKQGINAIDESFGCRGKCWAIFNRKHPSEEDLKAAKVFAKGVAGKLVKELKV